MTSNCDVENSSETLKNRERLYAYILHATIILTLCGDVVSYDSDSDLWRPCIFIFGTMRRVMREIIGMIKITKNKVHIP